MPLTSTNSICHSFLGFVSLTPTYGLNNNITPVVTVVAPIVMTHKVMSGWITRKNYTSFFHFVSTIKDQAIISLPPMNQMVMNMDLGLGVVVTCFNMPFRQSIHIVSEDISWRSIKNRPGKT
jgi:hypothetical protein